MTNKLAHGPLSGRPVTRRRVFTSDSFYFDDPASLTQSLAHSATSTTASEATAAAVAAAAATAAVAILPDAANRKAIAFRLVRQRARFRIRPCARLTRLIPSCARGIVDDFKGKFAGYELPLIAVTSTRDSHGDSWERRRYVSVVLLPGDPVCSPALAQHR